MLSLLLLLLALAGSLQADSLLLELAQLATRNGTLEQTPCVQQLRQLQAAWQAGHSWALKAFDASGGGLHNFMLGNSLWLGNPYTCRGLNEPLLQDFTHRQQELLRDGAPFDHAYSVAYLSTNSSWRLALRSMPRPLLHIGLCVPSSCDPEQLELLLSQAVTAASSSWPQRFESQLEVVSAKRPVLRNGFLAVPGFRWLIRLLGGSLLLLLLGSTRWKSNKFLACFDVAANWRRLWHIPVAGNQEIAVINGLRVCSAALLLCLHVIFYQIFSVNHSADLAETLATISLRNGLLPAALEVFFAVSGFLTVSNFLADKSLQHSIATGSLPSIARRFMRQVAQRYLRLAPLQCVVMLLTVVSLGYQREVSVFQVFEPIDELCMRNWWRNLLFVQNLYPIPEMCCNWTWSLGGDMQMYIVAMLLLYTHTRYPQLVRRAVWVLFIGNMVYSVLLIVMLDVHITMEELYNVGDRIYTNPLVRMLTYLVGCVYGYAHVNEKNAPFEALLPTKAGKIALAGATLWMITQLAGPALPGPFVIAIIMVLGRALISAGVAHLIFCSFRINSSYSWTRCLVRFLESVWFQRLNRITYAFYLLNPVILLNFYYSLSDGIPTNSGMLLALCAAHLVIVSLFSIPLTLFFEVPSSRLASLLLPSNSTKSKRS